MMPHSARAARSCAEIRRSFKPSGIETSKVGAACQLADVVIAGMFDITGKVQPPTDPPPPQLGFGPRLSVLMRPPLFHIRYSTDVFMLYKNLLLND